MILKYGTIILCYLLELHRSFLEILQRPHEGEEKNYVQQVVQVARNFYFTHFLSKHIFSVADFQHWNAAHLNSLVNAYCCCL